MQSKFRFLALCLVILTLAFESCGSNPQKAGPRETAEAFLKAMQFGDYEKAKTYCSEGTAKNLALVETIANIGVNPMAQEFTIKDVKEDGDYATITYDQGDDVDKHMQLRKDDGKWVVVMSKTEMGGTKQKDDTVDVTDDASDEPKVSPAVKYLEYRQGKSAKEVAEAFMKALEFGDYEVAMRYGSETTNDMLDYQKSMAALGNDKKEEPKKTILRVEEDGDFAKAFYREGDKKGEKELKMGKDENGNWEVIASKADMAEEE